MSQDIVADGLNRMMNAVKANKNVVVLKHKSKLLLSILAIAKLKGYVKSYQVEKGKLTIEIERLNGCKAIKPRFIVNADDIDKYITRYLPARDIGFIVVSTSQGIMTHQTAQDKNIGGSLLAFIY